MCLRWGARTIGSAGAWGTESPGGAVLAQTWARRGPHLSVSADGLSSDTGFGGSGAGTQGGTRGQVWQGSAADAWVWAGV